MNSSMDSEFSAYHMKCINMFRWSSLTRTVIRKDGSTGYSVKPSPIASQILFFVYFLNTSAKLIFLLFLVTDHLGPIEFLDRICGLDYLLCGAMVCISYIIWQRYPLYEVIYRLWEVENRIYRNLGSPREIKWESEEKHSVTVWAHVLLACLGCCSLMIQFSTAPKYCVFTYSLIESDNFYLQILFCSHEVLFLSHAWFAMSCSNGLCSFEAVNLSNIIKQMSKEVDELAKQGKFGRGFLVDVVANGHDNNGRGIEIKKKRAEKEADDKRESSQAFQYSSDRVAVVPVTEGASASDADQSRIVGSASHYRRISKELGGNTEKLVYSNATGRYNFRQILHDYQELMLASEQFNAWIGYKIVFLSIIAFGQYISSATMGFQVLRMEGTGIGDIWFYIQDCMVATYVTFRVFDYMSIVLPASEGFLDSVRNYQSSTLSVGKHLHKFIKTLKPVSLKLGPNPLGRETVLATMDMMANYYVCVALW